jgi:CRP-like cAMP-binding protein
MLVLLQKYASLVRGLQMQAENVVFNNKQKLARLLVNFQSYAPLGEVTSEIEITHECLSSFLGTTRAKVSEHLSQMEKSGYIKKYYNKILVLDPDGLSKLYE